MFSLTHNIHNFVYYCCNYVSISQKSLNSLILKKIKKCMLEKTRHCSLTIICTVKHRLNPTLLYLIRKPPVKIL